MQTEAITAVDPWRIEILTVRGQTSAARGALSRDAARDLLLRPCRGAYVEAAAFRALSPEDQHRVRVRAFTAVSLRPLLISHWSGAVVHREQVLWPRLTKVHATFADDDDRHRAGLVTHRLSVQDSEIVLVGDVLVTSPARTAIDIAGATALEEGVITIDDVLHRGMPRAVLEEAAAVAGPRRAARRIRDAIAFGHPGAETAAESRTLVSLMRSGFEVPVLQLPMQLSDGSEAFVDAVLPKVRVGVETDGERKYRDAAMAKQGAAQAVIDEKWREDEVRLQLQALVRPGWVQSGNAAMIRTLLGRVGVRPTEPPTPFEAYCEAAQAARPRARWR